MNEFLNINNLTDEELITTYGNILSELYSRGIVRTKNIVGELGERYCALKLGLELAPPNEKNIDAKDLDGNGYSIKTLSSKSAKRTGAFHIDKNHDKSEKVFDQLLVVILSESMQLEAIYSFSWLQFWTLKSWSSTQKAFFLPLTQKNLAEAKIL